MAVYTEVSDEELAAFLAGYDIGQVLSFKGIAEGVENSNYLPPHRAPGIYILTLYEKRVREADLPFFLGLMEHLAGTRPQLPAAGPATGSGEALGRLAGRPGRDRHLPRRRLGAPPERQPLPRRRRGAGAAARGRRGFRDGAAERALASQGWRPLFAAAPRPQADTVAPGLAERTGASSRISSGAGRPACPAASSTPTSSPTTSSSSARDGVGPDRLLFRLHRRPRLRPRDLPQRLVLRADGSFNLTKGRAMIAGYEAVRPLAATEIEALPMLCRGAALRFMLTRLVDWLNVPPGALVQAEGPARIRPQARFHRTRRERRRIRPRADERRTGRRSTPTAPAPGIRARAAGPRSCCSRAARRSCPAARR